MPRRAGARHPFTEHRPEAAARGLALASGLDFLGMGRAGPPRLSALRRPPRDRGLPSAPATLSSPLTTPRVSCPHEGPRGELEGGREPASDLPRPRGCTFPGSTAELRGVRDLLVLLRPSSPRMRPPVVRLRSLRVSSLSPVSPGSSPVSSIKTRETRLIPLVVSRPGRSSGFSEAPGRKALAALVPGHMMSPSVSAVSATCLHGGNQ